MDKITFPFGISDALKRSDAADARQPVKSGGALQEGIALYDEGEVQKAYDFFLSVTLDENDERHERQAADLNYYIGLCCAALCKYDDALAFLEQVVTGAQAVSAGKDGGRLPEETERILQCRLILAVIYTLTGRHSTAEFEMQKLLDAGYKEDSVYCAAAFLSWEERDAEKSIAYYERALDVNAQNITALNGLGYVLCQEGRDLTRALECCNMAVEMKRSAATLDSLGCVYLKLGMASKAAEYLNEALEICTDAGQRKIIEEHLGREQGGG